MEHEKKNRMAQLRDRYSFQRFQGRFSSTSGPVRQCISVAGHPAGLERLPSVKNSAFPKEKLSENYQRFGFFRKKKSSQIFAKTVVSYRKLTQEHDAVVG